MLKYITIAKCPECGCTEIVKESVQHDFIWDKPEIFVHSNGTRNETRQFLCGCIIKFEACSKIQVIQSQYCWYNAKNVAARRKLVDDKELLKKFMIEKDLSPELISRLKSYVLL